MYSQGPQSNQSGVQHNLGFGHFVRIVHIGFDELSHMQRMGGSAMARLIIKNPSKGQIWAENSNC